MSGCCESCSLKETRPILSTWRDWGWDLGSSWAGQGNRCLRTGLFLPHEYPHVYSSRHSPPAAQGSLPQRKSQEMLVLVIDSGRKSPQEASGPLCASPVQGLLHSCQ